MKIPTQAEISTNSPEFLERHFPKWFRACWIHLPIGYALLESRAGTSSNTAVVLAIRTDGEQVAWTYNRETRACIGGHYGSLAQDAYARKVGIYCEQSGGWGE